MIKYRSILLRSNRVLGASLVDNNLIKVEDLEVANQKLLQMIQAENFKQASILNILMYDLKVITEATLINHLDDTCPLGLVDLANYDLEKGFKKEGIDLQLCWATWTLPFDHIEDFYFLATTYYLSPPTIKFWEDKLEGHLLWYATTIRSITEALNRWESIAEEKEA